MGHKLKSFMDLLKCNPQRDSGGFGLFCASCIRKGTYWAQLIAVGGSVLAKEKGPCLQSMEHMIVTNGDVILQANFCYCE